MSEREPDLTLGKLELAPEPHAFHIVDPSPWPILTALAALVLAGGSVMWWHGGSWAIPALGGVSVLALMAAWWRSVLREARHDHAHTDPVRRGLRLGFGLFIFSEAMFFVAFFWAYFNSGFKVNPAITQWPPAGIVTVETWGVPFLNTLILLASGLAVNWAHHSLLSGDRKGLSQGLGLAVGLGAVFLSLQALEYAHTAFAFTGGVYPSVFYMATGFHGFHVMVGLIFLAVNLARARRGDFTPSQHVGFEASAWYWHFVDVVWLFLFVWVYWWGS